MAIPISIKDLVAPGKPLIFKEEYFTDPDFKTRFDFQMKLIRNLIRQRDDQELIKFYLNGFVKASFSLIKDEELKLHMHLENYKTLIHYGEVFDSAQTFQNIIKSVENDKLKKSLLSKYPLKTYLIYGEAWFKYYGLENQKNEGWFTEDSYNLISRAKYYLLKVYSQKIEGKNKLDEGDFNYCLVLLSGCFMSLSRWFEPIYYLKQLKEREDDDPNYDYLIALNLDALKEKSCLNYNGQLLLKIIDCATSTIENTKADPRQISGANEIRESSIKNIQDAKLSIDRLRKHKTKIQEQKRRSNPYFTYCIDHQLFLNEHSFFCNCRRSMGDSLEIKTSHLHTQLEWVKKFEILLDVLIADYQVARQNLFQNESVEGFRFNFKKENTKSNAFQKLRDARLKNSFKTCYSILDQISYGIFEALEIDIKMHLAKSAENETNIPKTYFLNMWDQYQFSQEDFRNNIYLISLYSISKDLDRNKYSALKSFKAYRNAMEHGMLFIAEEVNSREKLGLKDSKIIPRHELLAKTKLLMILTKSAIFSYANLVRRASKLKEIEITKLSN